MPDKEEKKIWSPRVESALLGYSSSADSIGEVAKNKPELKAFSLSPNTKKESRIETAGKTAPDNNPKAIDVAKGAPGQAAPQTIDVAKGAPGQAARPAVQASINPPVTGDTLGRANTAPALNAQEKPVNPGSVKQAQIQQKEVAKATEGRQQPAGGQEAPGSAIQAKTNEQAAAPAPAKGAEDTKNAKTSFIDMYKEALFTAAKPALLTMASALMGDDAKKEPAKGKIDAGAPAVDNKEPPKEKQLSFSADNLFSNKAIASLLSPKLEDPKLPSSQLSGVSLDTKEDRMAASLMLRVANMEKFLNMAFPHKWNTVA